MTEILATHCTARQCSPLRRKLIECSINNPALSLLMKHLVIGQRLKTPNFSAFHCSPRGSLVSIGQHFIATRVVHLPKSTETSLISESDQIGPTHQLLQLCTASTAWSVSDQAVRAVHSCISWFHNVSFIYSNHLSAKSHNLNNGPLNLKEMICNQSYRRHLLLQKI